MAYQVLPQQMWTLQPGRRVVRLHLPALVVAGLAKPVHLKIDFDADSVDRTIERLLVLRAQMLPKPPSAEKLI